MNSTVTSSVDCDHLDAWRREKRHSLIPFRFRKSRQLGQCHLLPSRCVHEEFVRGLRNPRLPKHGEKIEQVTKSQTPHIHTKKNKAESNKTENIRQFNSSGSFALWHFKVSVFFFLCVSGM